MPFKASRVGPPRPARSARPSRTLTRPPKNSPAGHTGEVVSVYLMDADIEKLMEFLSRKHN